MKTVLLFVLVVAMPSQAFSQTSFWESTNGPYGGIIYELAIDEISGRIYAGATGGLFYSDDGLTWSNAHPDLDGLNVQSVFVSNHDVFIVAEVRRQRTNYVFRYETGELEQHGRRLLYFELTENHDVLYCAHGRSISKSIDSGESWTVVNSQLSQNISKILAFGDSAIVVGTDKGGILRSMDNGVSFESVQSLGSAILSFVRDGMGNLFAGAKKNGIFRSTNDAKDWQQVNAGLANKNVPSMAVTSSGSIFAGTRGGVHLSTDNGATWAPKTSGQTSFYIRSIVVDSGDGVFLASERGVLFATENADRWIKRNAGLLSTSVTGLAASGDGEVFAGTARGGMFVTQDRGATWLEINTGIVNPRIRSLMVSAPHEIFMGNDGGGIWYSSDSGNRWRQLSLAGKTIRLLKPKSPGSILAVYSERFIGDVIARSTDNGNSWRTIHSGLQVRHVKFGDDGAIYAGFEFEGGVIKRSKDEGVSWEILTNIPYTVLGLYVDGLEIFATTLGEIHYSMDGGENWEVVFKVSSGNELWNIKRDPTTGHLLVLGKPYVDEQFKGILESTDNGRSWKLLEDQDPVLYLYRPSAQVDGYVLTANGGRGVMRSTRQIFAVETPPRQPLAFALQQNYPNPFNGETDIRLTLAEDEMVRLEIFNLLGERVRTLASRRLTSGLHSIKWDGRDENGIPAVSGVFIYRMTTRKFARSRKLLLLR